MSERIRIETHGHQVYVVNEGQLLQYCQTVEIFDGKPMQVPAVMLKTDDGKILTIPVKEQYRWTVIEEAKP